MTSRLEFWKHPELMAQFPFAHSIEMTSRLHDGMLEVRTTIENLSADPMPVGIGYHPYFQLHDAPRDQWKVHLAARDHLALSKMLIPTGERKPVEFPRLFPLAGVALDDVFGGLVRDGFSNASRHFLRGRRARKNLGDLRAEIYLVAVVYAPPGRPVHLLRADVRHHRWFQSGARRRVPGVAEHPAGRGVARELLDRAEWILRHRSLTVAAQYSSVTFARY